MLGLAGNCTEIGSAFDTVTAGSAKECMFTWVSSSCATTSSVSVATAAAIQADAMMHNKTRKTRFIKHPILKSGKWSLYDPLSDDLAGDHGVFIEMVDRAEPVI